MKEIESTKATMSTLIVQDVLALKNRGPIISVSNVWPKIGDTLRFNSYSWIVKSIENYDGYLRWLLLSPVGKPGVVSTGYVLAKVEI